MGGGEGEGGERERERERESTKAIMLHVCNVIGLLTGLAGSTSKLWQLPSMENCGSLLERK